jgi:hypothetical protein
LELIRTKFISKKDIQKFDYKAVKEKLINKFPKEILTHTYNFEMYDYEPYCKFLFWLAFNFKTFYLTTKRHSDGMSNILYNHKGKVICMHSWVSRFYKKPLLAKIYKVPKGNTARIDALKEEVYTMRNVPLNKFHFSDRCQFFFDGLIRLAIKIPMRIARWPRKLRKKLS